MGIRGVVGAAAGRRASRSRRGGAHSRRHGRTRIRASLRQRLGVDNERVRALSAFRRRPLRRLFGAVVRRSSRRARRFVRDAVPARACRIPQFLPAATGRPLCRLPNLCTATMIAALQKTPTFDNTFEIVTPFHRQHADVTSRQRQRSGRTPCNRWRRASSGRSRPVGYTTAISTKRSTSRYPCRTDRASSRPMRPLGGGTQS